MNLKILKRLFPKSFENNLILDYDNIICYTEKKDALLTYKKEKGYQPGVGFIGSKVVYVENRNGNSTVHVLQEDTLTRMFKLLLSHNINISKFRADSASYNWRTIQTIDQYTDTFYVRDRGYTEEWNTIENTITISEGGNSCGYINFIKTKFWSGGHCYSLINLEHNIVIEYLYQSLKFN